MSQVERYCTLFNAKYLARGLTLYKSIARHEPNFHLYVLCMDDATYDVLTRLSLPRLTPIRLSDFENPDLLSVKKDRTVAEYCWTCAPAIIRYCLDHFRLGRVTYLDSDLFFFSSPNLLVDEMLRADGSVSLTEHRYAKDYAKKRQDAGIYCVQFMTFVNDEAGRTALDWWYARCIEWCYARVEDGKFGDQKYLDDWTTRFKKIHVITDRGCGIAPWNVQQLVVTRDSEGNVLIDCAQLRFYHFHNLKILTIRKADLCRTFYYLSQHVQEYIYKPYLHELSNSLQQLQDLKDGQYDLFKETWKGQLLNLARRFVRRYYVMEI